ncbi:shikimate dehydrogenase family protein [Fluviispira vulneris]|uniref:shikimate dehydrogenase family protein n=1 Tax=Fluviispira vulneris TaxID=2763012 RepID=UPI0016442B03|nr:hypothetical protein [Fluviispira vulneris]
MSKVNSVTTSFVPDGKTKYCFLFGASIEKSLSPGLHTNWFQKENLNCIYLPMPVTTVDLFSALVLNLVETEGFIGGNITSPYKNSIVNMNIFEMTESVQAIQAANTIYRNNRGNWCLENTDIFGVKKSIQHLITKEEKYYALVLGGGGAAAAALYNCSQDKNCLKSICFTRNPSKTIACFPLLTQQRNVAVHFLVNEELNKTIEQISQEKVNLVIINSLPIGFSSGEKNLFVHYVIERALLNMKKNYIFYFDMIYTDTVATSFAKKNKIKAINGKKMLEEQAKKSFALWREQLLRVK